MHDDPCFSIYTVSYKRGAISVLPSPRAGCHVLASSFKVVLAVFDRAFHQVRSSIITRVYNAKGVSGWAEGAVRPRMHFSGTEHNCDLHNKLPFPVENASCLLKVDVKLLTVCFSAFPKLLLGGKAWHTDCSPHSLLLKVSSERCAVAKRESRVAAGTAPQPAGLKPRRPASHLRLASHGP